MSVVERAALPDALVQHLESAYPNEGCGLLLEDPGTGALRVRRMRNACEAHRAAASHPSPGTAFAFEPSEWLGVLLEAEARGQRVACVYHSHPNTEAYLSPEDVRWAAPGGEPLLPGVSYLVVSVEAGRVTHGRCFAWRGGGFGEVPGFP